VGVVQEQWDEDPSILQAKLDLLDDIVLVAEPLVLAQR
jgi:hypothetical protein